MQSEPSNIEVTNYRNIEITGLYCFVNFSSALKTEVKVSF